MKPVYKWSLWGIALLLIAGYAAWSATRPLPAETFVAEPQTFRDVVREEGIIHAHRELAMSSALGGTLSRLAVREGDRVRKGDLLFEQDTTELAFQIKQLQARLISLDGQQKLAEQPAVYQAELDRQQLAIELAALQLEQAKQDEMRLRSLFAAQAVSAKELEAAEQAVKQAENLLSQQQAALSLLKERDQPKEGLKEQYAGEREALRAQIALLSYQKGKAQVRALTDGIVQSIAYENGEYVPAGKVVLSLFQAGPYEVKTYLLAEDVGFVKKGMAVRLIQELKGREVSATGYVSRIASSAVEKQSTLGLEERRVEVVIQSDKMPPDWRPGYEIEVEFLIHEEKGKMVLPQTVLFPYQQGDAVWVVRDGRAVVQPVEKGYETVDKVVIEKGLNPGDRVIRNPQLEGLKEGKKIVDL